MHRHQLSEFGLRAAVQAPIDVIRSATCIAAELFNEAGETGVVAEGARADLLVVEGDPLHDVECLQDPDRHLKVIMKDGVLYRNALP
jgi:imidazolonepropionase-like amidohydrolase